MVGCVSITPLDKEITTYRRVKGLFTGSVVICISISTVSVLQIDGRGIYFSSIYKVGV